MTNLIKHLWNNNREEVLASSFLNCHVKGLHSIMLLDQPGARIRMFVTSKHHEMWRNNPRTSRALSLGFHQHRTDLVLETVQGCFINHTMSIWPAWDTVELDRFAYSSKIVDGEVGFKRIGRSVVSLHNPSCYGPGHTVAMHASEYHTVEVPWGLRAAWLVYEGSAWSEYSSHVYTNADLEAFDGKGMYERATPRQIQELLRFAVGGSL